MSSLNPNAIYCRIESGKIIEYPVLPIHITNRNHPANFYTEVYFEKKPSISRFQELQEKIRLLAGKYPVVEYVISDLTFEQIVSQLKAEAAGEDGLIDVAKLDVPTIQHISDLCDERMSQELDNFASTRRYKNVDSMAKYYDSKVEAFRVESLHVRQLCEQVYAGLIKYLELVLTKKEPFPETWSAIMAKVPELKWSSER